MSRIFIFDLGNVVFPLEMKEFYTWIDSIQTVQNSNFEQEFHDLYFKFERGDFDPMEYFVKLRNELKLEFEDNTFIEHWLSFWRTETPGIEDVIKKIKAANIPLHLLSNTNAIHMDTYFKTKPILEYFDSHFLSYQMHCAKPEPVIYEKVTKELGADLKQITFFDDKPENVEAANQFGWNAIVFNNSKQILDELKKL